MTASAASARRRWAHALLISAGVFAFWTALLLVSIGGVDWTVFGLRIRSNNPRHPGLLAVAAYALAWVLDFPTTSQRTFRGLRSIWLGIRWVALSFARAILRLTHAILSVDDRLTVAVLALTVAGAACIYGARSSGGADTSGYISQADLWLTGRVINPQPNVDHAPWPGVHRTLSPLGYTPMERDGGWVQVPVYGPGLPMMLAVAKRVFGQTAMYLIVPIMAGLLVGVTYLLGRRLAGSRVALCAAWLVATSPPVHEMMLNPMSDIPVALAWAMVFVSAGRGIGRGAIAGAFASVALLIRPNHLPAFGLTALWFLGWTVLASPADRAHRRRALAGAAVAMTLGLAIVTTIQWQVYGSPFISGYGDPRATFAWSHVWPNVKNYVAWLAERQTPIVFLGLAAIAMPFRWLWSDTRDRAPLVLCLLIVGAIFAEYFAYLVFDSSHFLRFVLAAWAPVMIGVGQVLRRVAGRSRLAAAAAVSIVIAVGGRGLWSAHERHLLDAWKQNSRYAAMGEMVRDHTEENSIIFSMMHSGSLRYYGGRTTIRFDFLDPDWLDRTVDWLAAQGVHPYAVLEEFERQQFRDRFGARSALGNLPMPPVVDYRTGDSLVLYDLLRDDGPTEVVHEDYRDTSARVPATPPVIPFGR